jgi:hypothetical protein
MSERNHWLAADDAELSSQCRLEFFKGSGNGGQHRNKTSSAVRVRHLPSGLAAEDCSGRSQHANRARALRKLRLKIAFEFREEPSPPPRPRVGMEHAEYPLWCAAVLDHLALADWNPVQAAPQLGLTASALVKLLCRDPGLWQEVNSRRGVPLRKP